jgi:tRNA threonylcarbamoyladenosine biosynthesis protein TsaE
MHKLKIKSVDELDKVIDIIKQFYFEQSKVILLNGDLGSGKTTFTQRLLKNLGYIEPVDSPTYTIVNEYQLNHHIKVFHFDLYRIKHKEELYEIGFEEYFAGKDNYTIIEWPTIAMDLIEPPYININIAVMDNETRNFDVTLQID